jgi:hypothetical protein
MVQICGLQKELLTCPSDMTGCAPYFSLNFTYRRIRSHVWKPLIIAWHLRFPWRWMWSVVNKIHRSLFRMYTFINHVAVDIFIHTYLRFRLFAVEPQLYYYELSSGFWVFLCL